MADLVERPRCPEQPQATPDKDRKRFADLHYPRTQLGDPRSCHAKNHSVDRMAGSVGYREHCSRRLQTDPR